MSDTNSTGVNPDESGRIVTDGGDGHPTGITVESVASGFIARLNHGDGSATGFWGVTPLAAMRKAEKIA
jgi:hypothetical protein